MPVEPGAQRVIKTAQATRLTGPIFLDGDLSEPAWQEVPQAGDFIQLAPLPGRPPSQATWMRFAYNDQALFIAARMEDTAPDSILQQLSPRDEIANTDEFGIWFSTFNDGVNGVRFATTPRGIQIDDQLTGNIADVSWNAVWNVVCQVDSAGWTAEFRIPWMAFRFADLADQTWGINAYRTLRRLREESVWNPMDPTQEGLLNQGGVLQGISGIDPPLRISLIPYFSAYANHAKGVTVGSYTGGMDLKLGLGESFTLDATLIPDFGQVISDNLVLNLSPFEIEFDENRPFFKEDADLFTKGGIFYSRRIGQEGRLLNATKVTGRTAGGTGLGLLQSFTFDDEAGVDPVDALNGYTVAVIDQNLPHNSYATATTTWVHRSGSRPDALVQSAVFELLDDRNRWSVSGGGAFNRHLGVSDPGAAGLTEGDRWNLGISKISGPFRVSLGRSEESKGFDPNDLGFLAAANEIENYVDFSYRIVEPFGRWNSMRMSLSSTLSEVEFPRGFSRWQVFADWFGTTRKFDTWSASLGTMPLPANDIFSSRIDGLTWREPGYVYGQTWVSTDYRRRFALDALVSYALTAEYRDWTEHTFRLAPRFRLNDRWMFDYVWKVQRKGHERGWADVVESPSGPVSLYGDRDNLEVTQVFNASVIFTNRMSLTCRVRHAWSRVRYHGFLVLDPATGGLLPSDLVQVDPATGTTPDYDLNYNAWSIDCVYRWNFSPGSDLQLVWKNNLLTSGSALPDNYAANFAQMLESGFLNSLSIRINFFVDYSRMRQGIRGFNSGA